MSRDVEAVWKRVCTDSISFIVKSAKIHAIESRTTLLSKMTVTIDVAEKARLFLQRSGFQDENSVVAR
jgi:hypothetical protein